MSPILSTDLEKTCSNIVRHIMDISSGTIQITRMILYFKIDHNNKLWLMFCSNIKIKDKNNANFYK